MTNASGNQFSHDERFEEFQSHFFRQTALIELQFRSDDDNRTTGEVDALTQKVLTETTLLTSEHAGQRFEISVARACHRLAASAVVDEGVDGFLKHTFFVSYNDFRRADFLKTFKAIVAVDNPSVKVVEVAGGESAAVERNHRAKIGRNDRKHVQNHPARFLAGFFERVQNFKAFYGLKSLLTYIFGYDFLRSAHSLSRSMRARSSLIASPPIPALKVQPLSFAS